MWKDLFYPQSEELIGFEVLYLSGIGAVTYLANSIPSNINFPINLVSIYSFATNQRHYIMIRANHVDIIHFGPKTDNIYMIGSDHYKLY